MGDKEERHGCAGALRASEGMEGHFGGPHAGEEI